jgi:hypothetical protein
VFDFDLEKAKNLLLYNLEVRQNNQKVFEKRDIYSEAIQQAIEIYQIYVMPRNTLENHKVSIFRLGDSDPSKFSLFDILRMASASLDARFVVLDDNELINGEILIHDMQGYSLQHLLKCVANASILCKYMKYSQEAAPCRLIENHFINCSPVVTRIVNFFKTFLNADTVRSLKFHSSLETLYESVDRELLPNDLGGSAGDVADIFRVWKEKFMSKR